jgi:hypothetical protein
MATGGHLQGEFSMEARLIKEGDAWILAQLEHSASPSENSEKFLGGNFPQVVWRRVRFLQNADCWLSDAL